MSQFPQPAPQPWGQPPQQPGYGAPQQPPQGYPPQQPAPQQWANPQAPQQPYPAPSAYPGTSHTGPAPGYAAPGFAAPPPQVPVRGGPIPGLFGGVGPQNRKASRANYIRPGNYWARIDLVKSDIAPRSRSAFFAVEMTIIRVLNDVMGRSHRVGENVSYFRDQKSYYFLSDMQEFVAQVSGTPFEQVTEDMVMDVVGPRQPFNNTIVQIDATEIITKANKPFTVVKWNEIPPAEALRTLDPQTVAHFFANGLLERMAAADRRMGSPGQAPQGLPQAQPQQYQQPAPAAPGYAPQPGAYPAQAAPVQPVAAVPPAVSPPPAGQYVQDASQPTGWRWVPSGR